MYRQTAKIHMRETRIYKKEDGRFLLDYGSGRESLGLLIISPVKKTLDFWLNPEIHTEVYKGLPAETVNIGGYDLVAYRGRFFTTKKGLMHTSCAKMGRTCWYAKPGSATGTTSPCSPHLLEEPSSIIYGGRRAAAPVCWRPSSPHRRSLP